MRRNTLAALLAAALVVPAVSPTLAGDWPTWGHDASRNMVSAETNLPDSAKPGKVNDDTGEVDLKGAEHVAWTARLGSQTYGNPVVAGGRVYVGTNNGKPRDEKYQGDYGVLLCLDEQTGKMLWQLAVPKLAAGRNVDWEECGVCSSPAIDGERVYVVTNRCEVVCLDVAGMADGNEGPFKDEAQYTAGPGKPPIPQGAADADIVWRYDLRHELGVFPHFQTASNPLVVGDRLYITTSNGVDWSDRHVPSPDAPALICLDKKTGKLLGRERSGISARTLYCNWSAPAYGTVGGKPTLVFGGGDGFLYGFDPAPTPSGDLAERWRIDCNPPEYRARDGKPVKYRSDKGPSEVIATPVVFDDKVYVPIGQDPEHGSGAGALSCVAVTYAGDKATPAIAWQNKNVGRSMSTVSIANGVLIVPELAGVIHCVDPATGKAIWRHDAESNVWGSALVADGKAYVGTEAGEVVVLGADKAKQPPTKIDLGGAVFSTPVAANGALYVATGTQLYKLKK
jgi:outer membrane protein assembly factor BamB